MKHNIKRILSLLLTIVAIVSLFTMPAAAADGTDAQNNRNRGTIITSKGRIKVQVANSVWYTYPEGFEMPTVYTGEKWGYCHSLGFIHCFFRDIASRDACYNSYGVFDYGVLAEQKELKNAVSETLISDLSWDNDMTRDAFVNGQVAVTNGNTVLSMTENAFLRDDIIRNIIVVGKGVKGIEAVQADDLAYVGPNAFKQSKLETILFTKDWDGLNPIPVYHSDGYTTTVVDHITPLFTNGMAFGKEALIIDEGAFSSCDNLTTVWFEKEPAALYLGPNAFANCPKLTIHAPAGGRIEAHCKAYGINFESTGETADPQPYAGEPGGTIPLPYERYGVTELSYPNHDGFPADNSAVKPGEYIEPFTDVAADAPYAEAVRWAKENGVVNGTSATTFAPRGSLTRAQAVQIFYNQAGTPDASALRNPFADVAEGVWYTPAIKWAAENGIVHGTSATGFTPDGRLTRAQILQILYNKEGTPDVSGYANPFADVAEDAWYASAIKWAAAQGLCGDGSTYSPEQICTRAEIVQILYQMAHR